MDVSPTISKLIAYCWIALAIAAPLVAVWFRPAATQELTIIHVNCEAPQLVGRTVPGSASVRLLCQIPEEPKVNQPTPARNTET